ISGVRWLEGDEVWKWRDSPAGSWSAPLLTAALSNGHNKAGKLEDNCKSPVAFLLDYRDGFKAAAYMLQGHATGWTFATKARNSAKILSTGFGSPDIRKLANFDGLVHCIEELFVSGQPVYPVERTLLTTGALAALFDSRETQKKVFTPGLKITYHAPAKAYFQKK
ncbi:MAG: hypothetical protein ABIZ80_06545, partial [Bryobacteraceae bacterium]